MKEIIQFLSALLMAITLSPLSLILIIIEPFCLDKYMEDW